MKIIKTKQQSQVVFLFNMKENIISELLGTYDDSESAIKEVEKLRKQGLPAFYASEGYCRGCVNG